MQQLVIGSDHRGFLLKEFIKSNLSSEFEFIDVGCYSKDSIDYPLVSKNFANKLKEVSLKNHDNDVTKTFGIIICGSAIGVSIAVNRFSFIRGALVFKDSIAQTSRQHNNANVICLPSDYLSNEEAVYFIKVFLNTKFEGGRHEIRVQELSNMYK